MDFLGSRLVFALSLAHVLALALPAWDLGAQDPPPPGRLVAVDGALMHIHCVGSGSPTVVIDAGGGAWSLAWLDVQERVAPLTRTCVYDRAGLGWSEARPGPGTSGRAAQELRELLLAADEEPPFALLGHSYGGYNVRVFADLHPEDVAGIGLIESAHEDQWERLPPIVGELVRASLEGIRTTLAAAEAGRLSPDSISIPAFFAEDPFRRAAYRAEQLDPDHHRTYLEELTSMDALTDRVRTAGGLGGIPLVVLSSARGFDRYRGTPIPVAESNRVWLELQGELASLSDDVVHLVTHTAGHTVHYEEPEVVAGVIRELVERIRKSRTGAPAP